MHPRVRVRFRAPSKQKDVRGRRKQTIEREKESGMTQNDK